MELQIRIKGGETKHGLLDETSVMRCVVCICVRVRTYVLIQCIQTSARHRVVVPVRRGKMK